MGIGFVILIHLVGLLVLSIVLAIIAGVITYYTTPAERRRRTMRVAIIAPFLGLYTFYFASLAGAMVVSEMKQVDMGIGDVWNVPLAENCQLVFIDLPEQASIEKNGQTVVSDVVSINQQKDRIFGKTADNRFFQYNTTTNKLEHYASGAELAAHSYEGIALAKKHGAWLSMDIYNTDYTQAEGKKNGVLEDNLRKDRDIAEAQRQNFARAHKAGVKMVYGTDAGVYPHGDNARQFAWMVRYGMTPLQAIRTATVNAAEALGRQGADVGEVVTGKQGDLIAVAGDPLADVRVLERVPVIIRGGAVVKDTRQTARP